MKNIRISLIIISVLSLGIFSCTGQQTESQSAYKDVNVEQASKLMKEKKNLLVLDVRTPGEVAQGKIEGAAVIDFQGATFNSNIDQLDKDQPILVYCAVGGRSSRTMSILKDKGFKEVYNLSGGIQAWTGAGKPVVK